ncbi:MAG: hypothetical protein QOE82_2387 [Thermoanaerobaculia bacterium]|jgi:alpha-tubulin suppressor-like RCC1 family protein|nr:hypothetical protein [Thermoanaerobaculia bacterium]
MGSHNGRDEEIYEQGVRDGQQADVSDQVVHSLVKGYTLSPRENEIYNKGYDYGISHRSARSGARSASSERHREERDVAESDATSLSNENGCAKVIGGIVVAAIVIAVVIWLLANVVLPVGLLNSAIIFTVLAFTLRERKTIFASLALVGGCYMLADIANGWFSANFIKNVVHDKSWLTGFVYANAAAVGVSAWILVRPRFLLGSMVDAAEKRKALLSSVAALTIILGVTSLPPIIYSLAPDLLMIGAPRNNLTESTLATRLTSRNAVNSASLEDGVSQIPKTINAPVLQNPTSSSTTEQGGTETAFTTGPVAQPASRGTWTSASISQNTVCAVTKAGAAYCWGSSFSGRVNRAPVAVMAEQKVAAVSVGSSFVCWLTTTGAAYCSGRNDNGELGNGREFTVAISGNRDSAVPTAVARGHTFSLISAGGSHTCALTTEGRAYCWGDNQWRQLGTGTQVDGSSVPVTVTGDLIFVALSAGFHHTCGVTTKGDMYCWGSGYLGDGAYHASSVPIAVGNELEFVSVTASISVDFTCGLTKSGAAYCWGEGRDGELGNGSTEASLVPVAIPGMTFKTLSAGDEYSCGITTDGQGYCWGSGIWGNLGNGATKSSLTPVQVSGSIKFASIHSGTRNTCGVANTGDLYCWGPNEDGELAGAAKDRFVTAPIVIPQP